VTDDIGTDNTEKPAPSSVDLSPFLLSPLVGWHEEGPGGRASSPPGSADAQRQAQEADIVERESSSLPKREIDIFWEGERWTIHSGRF
jgi:hypothetical protein